MDLGREREPMRLWNGIRDDEECAEPGSRLLVSPSHGGQEQVGVGVVFSRGLYTFIHVGNR